MRGGSPACIVCQVADRRAAEAIVLNCAVAAPRSGPWLIRAPTLDRFGSYSLNSLTLERFFGGVQRPAGSSPVAVLQALEGITFRDSRKHGVADESLAWRCELPARGDAPRRMYCLCVPLNALKEAAGGAPHPHRALARGLWVLVAEASQDVLVVAENPHADDLPSGSLADLLRPSPAAVAQEYLRGSVPILIALIVLGLLIRAGLRSAARVS